jgi:hypothetical protein
LIEHCFFNDEISSAFTDEQICEAVEMLVKPEKRGGEGKNGVV